MRVAVVAISGVALLAAVIVGVFSGGAAADEVPAAAVEGGVSHRMRLVGLLALGMIALALFGFDLRDWF